MKQIDKNKLNNCQAVIYKLHSDRSKFFYIGSTINMKRRFSGHKSASKKYPNRKIYKKFNKIGWNNIKITILKRVKKLSLLKFIEQKFINNNMSKYLLNSISCCLLNKRSQDRQG